MKDLSIIIPVFNEEKNISLIYNRISDSISGITSNYEIIFINDGSMDATLDEILKLSKHDIRVYYINFSRNFGHQIAVTAGLDKSLGNKVVIIDGDLQDPPELIHDMYVKSNEGYDVVYAKRKVRKGENLFKKVTAKLFYRTLRKLTSIDIPLDTGDFRLISRKVVDYLKQMPESNKFIRGQISWIGFKSTPIEFVRESRIHGKSGYPLSKMLKFAIDGITSFSDKPLQFVTKVGFTFSAIAFIVILYAIYSHFILNQTISGWTSMIISSMFIGGVQLISIGIIGEYVSRIHNNTRNRPLYIISDTNIDSN